MDGQDDGFTHLWSFKAILSRWSHVTWETLEWLKEDFYCLSEMQNPVLIAAM